MVVSEVEALRASFAQKGIVAARRALAMVRANAGNPAAQERSCFYLWQAMDICYLYAQAWQVVVDCALQAHGEMLRTGRWARWIGYLEMAITASRQLADKQAETTLLLYLARMQEMCGEWSTARSRLHEAVALANQTGDHNARGRALTHLSDLERQAGHLEEAEKQITLARQALEGSGDIHALSELYRNVGNLTFQRSKIPQALEFYAQALEYAKAAGNLRCMAAIYHNRGNLCAQQGDTRGAATQYHLALELFRQIEDVAGEAMTLSNIGLACQVDRGYWRQAVDMYNQVLTISEKAGYYQGQITAHSYLVDVFMKLGEVKPLAATVERLQVLFTKANDEHGLACLEHCKGILYLAQEEPETALVHLWSAQQSPQLASDPDEVAAVETNIGRAYAALGRYTEAEAAFKRAFALWALCTEWPGELETHVSQVELYRQMGDWDKFEPALEAARSLAQRIGREDALALLEAAAAQAHLAAGQIKAGCLAFEKALQNLAGYGENDRQAQYYWQVAGRALDLINTLKQTGCADDASCKRLEELIHESFTEGD